MSLLELFAIFCSSTVATVNYATLLVISPYTQLLEQNNPDIILLIAESYDTPKKILKKLAKDTDSDIAKAAKASLE